MKKIRILFDAEPLAAGQKAGIGYYTAGLVLALADAAPDEVELIGHYFDFLGRKRPQLPRAANLNFRVSRLLPRQLVNLGRRFGLSLPFEFLAKARGDLIVYPASISRPSLFGTPSVPVIHDLTYIDYPELVSKLNRQDLQRFVPKTLKKAPFLITTSHTVEAAIKQRYPWFKRPILAVAIPPQKIDKPSAATASRALSSLGVKKPFILFLGTLEPRKNIVNLIEAYNLLSEKLKSDYAMVLAGGRGWLDEPIRAAIDRAKANHLNIIETGYISDAQKAALYARAEFLIMPSVYEGYGMPIAEAMDSGLAVAVSDLPVFHEIAGPAALYFDPKDPKDIASKMEQLFSGQGTRQRLIKAGRARSKNLSWADVAETVLNQIRQTVR